MNIPAVLRHLTAKDDKTGEYKIPKIIYSDAYSSEMVAYADLILPDTTYLERWDCISLLDRPISGADAPADAIRQPVVAPDRDVRGFQIRAARSRRAAGIARLRHRRPAAPRYPGGYPDYIVNHERSPGIGSLAGFRGEDGKSYGRGAPNAEAARCLHRRRLLPRAPSRAGAALLQARQQGLSRLGQGRGLHRRSRADDLPALSRAAAEIPAGGARARRDQAAGDAPRAHREIFRPDPVLVSAVRQRTRATATFHSRPSRSGRCTCITRGARTTAGSARSRRRTAST